MKKLSTNHSLEARIKSYSSTAAAALLVAVPANASVVITAHGTTQNFDTITHLDIDGNGSIDVQLDGSSTTTTYSINVRAKFGAAGVLSILPNPTSTYYATGLNSSSSIPFTGPWRANNARVASNYSTANFPLGQTKYLGIKFKIGSNWHAGWIKLTVTQIAFQNSLYTIHEYAYETIPNTGISAPLPVELTSFTAVQINNGVKLNWKTATEVNNYGFEIQRAIGSQVSSDNFEKIGFVEGAGNSNSIKEYSFIDESVQSGNYFYRLKQIDTDGSFEYSDAIQVNLETPENFALQQNYPNPFNPTTIIKFTLPESGMVNLTVYNMLGQEVAVLLNKQMEAGNYEQEFSAANLPSGTYVYRIIVDNKYTSEKKMVVLK